MLVLFWYSILDQQFSIWAVTFSDCQYIFLSVNFNLLYQLTFSQTTETINLLYFLEGPFSSSVKKRASFTILFTYFQPIILTITSNRTVIYWGSEYFFSFLLSSLFVFLCLAKLEHVHFFSYRWATVAVQVKPLITDGSGLLPSSENL